MHCKTILKDFSTNYILITDLSMNGLYCVVFYLLFFYLLIHVIWLMLGHWGVVSSRWHYLSGLSPLQRLGASSLWSWASDLMNKETDTLHKQATKSSLQHLEEVIKRPFFSISANVRCLIFWFSFFILLFYMNMKNHIQNLVFSVTCFSFYPHPQKDK